MAGKGPKAIAEAMRANESASASQVELYTRADVEALRRGASEVLGALDALTARDVSMNAEVRNMVAASRVTLEAALTPFDRTPAKLIRLALEELEAARGNLLLGGPERLARARFLLLEAEGRIHG